MGVKVADKNQDFYDGVLQQLDPDSTQWQFVRVLGEGAFGAVIMVRSRVMGHFRALKVLNRVMQNNKKMLPRFKIEARIPMMLHELEVDGRQFIARVYHADITDVGVDRYSYLLMEYCPHGDLQQHLAAWGAMPPLQACEVTSDLLEGLHAAHTFEDPETGPCPLIHRDLKPANILIGRKGVVKITDWGIAKLRSGTLAAKTAMKGAMGTMYFMSPQQAKAAREADARDDVYSVGVMLPDFLKGGCLTESEMEPFFMLAYPPKGIDPHEGLWDGIDSRLVEIIKKATNPNRDLRYQSAREMRTAVARCLKEDLSVLSMLERHELGTAPAELERQLAERDRKAAEAAAVKKSAQPGQVLSLPGGGGSMTAVPEDYFGGGFDSGKFDDLPADLPPARAGGETIMHDADMDRLRRRNIGIIVGLVFFTFVVGAVGWMISEITGGDTVEDPVPVVEVTPPAPEPVVAEVEAPPEQPPEPVDVVEAPKPEPVRAKVKTPRSEPRASKAKASAPPPEPEVVVAEVEAPPEQPPEPATGMLPVLGWSGVERMRFVCDGQNITATGNKTTLPVGTCTAYVTFKDDMGTGEVRKTVVVEPGLVTLKCDGLTMTCR
jgi:serine/threonine protein kinase